MSCQIIAVPHLTVFSAFPFLRLLHPDIVSPNVKVESLARVIRLRGTPDDQYMYDAEEAILVRPGPDGVGPVWLSVLMTLVDPEAVLDQIIMLFQCWHMTIGRGSLEPQWNTTQV